MLQLVAEKVIDGVATDIASSLVTAGKKTFTIPGVMTIGKAVIYGLILTVWYWIGKKFTNYLEDQFLLYDTRTAYCSGSDSNP